MFPFFLVFYLHIFQQRLHSLCFAFFLCFRVGNLVYWFFGFLLRLLYFLSIHFYSWPKLFLFFTFFSFCLSSSSHHIIHFFRIFYLFSPPPIQYSNLFLPRFLLPLAFDFSILPLPLFILFCFYFLFCLSHSIFFPAVQHDSEYDFTTVFRGRPLYTGGE